MTGRDEQRADRLKAALRDNLRRRKTQARERADAGRPDPEPAPPQSKPGTPPTEP